MSTLLASQPVPVISFETLWHVGFFDAAAKTVYTYEGQGLSVSEHPDDWRAIARLSGPTWLMDKTDNAFCDYHSLRPEQIQAVITWGIERGYIEMAEVFEVTREDDEWECTFTSRFATMDEALEEVWDDDPEAITTVTLPVATDAFPDLSVRPGDIDPVQVLATLWVAENTDLDGTWWQDNYDPSRLSAPRGVIRVDKVQEWARHAA